MKKIILGALLLLSTLGFGQTTLTSWNFDQHVTTPNIGYGTINPLNTNYDGFSNPLDAFNINGFSTPNYDPPSGTAGYQINNSTTGYNGINISFDISGSMNSSGYFRCQYSIDNINYFNIIDGTINTTGSYPNIIWTHYNIQLPVNVDNQDNFTFRIVSIYSPFSCCSYSAYQGGSVGSTGGTWMIDNISINATSLSTNQNNINELNLYPNPTNGNIFLSTNTDKNIKIYDMIGNKIIDKDITNFLDTSNLSSGVYLCEITEGENKLTKKIIKN
jgi:hypothetical protein